MRTIRYSIAADRALARMNPGQAEKIEQKIERLALDPASLANNIKRLRGTNAYRLRVDSYRIIFDEDGYILDILAIAHRSDVYR